MTHLVRAHINSDNRLRYHCPYCHTSQPVSLDTTAIKQIQRCGLTRYFAYIECHITGQECTVFMTPDQIRHIWLTPPEPDLMTKVGNHILRSIGVSEQDIRRINLEQEIVTALKENRYVPLRINHN